MTSPLVIEFDPPGELLNMNDRRHRMAQARLVKLWRSAAYYEACRVLPVGPSKRLRHGKQRVTVMLPVKGNVRRDPSNWAPTLKAVVDGATQAGVFKDDSSEYVTVDEPVLRVGARKVRVVISDVATSD